MEPTRIEPENIIYQQALDLRYELFFEEFKLPKSIVIDDLEEHSEHFVIQEGNALIAYGRLTNLGFKAYKISQVVVQPAMQRKGHGTKLLKKMLSHATKVGATRVELNSQVSAKGIYAHLGFTEVGDVYPSKTTGLPHVKMHLEPATQQGHQFEGFTLRFKRQIMAALAEKGKDNAIR